MIFTLIGLLIFGTIVTVLLLLIALHFGEILEDRKREKEKENKGNKKGKKK